MSDHVKDMRENPIPCQDKVIPALACTGSHYPDKDGYATLPCCTCGFDLTKEEEE